MFGVLRYFKHVRIKKKLRNSVVDFFSKMFNQFSVLRQLTKWSLLIVPLPSGRKQDPVKETVTAPQPFKINLIYSTHRLPVANYFLTGKDLKIHCPIQ